LDTIWNLDAVETKLNDYPTAAMKIRGGLRYCAPEAESVLPTERYVEDKVAELFRIHPSLAAIRFWRLLVAALITDFDDHLEGESRSTEKLYDDVMAALS
jgi:hypothetical protein